MAKANLKVEGLDDLVRALRGIEPSMAKRAIRKALRAGMRPMLAQAKADAPKDTGLVRKKVRLKAGKRKKDVIRLNLSIGANDFQGKAFYGAFQEFGWKAGKRGSDGRRPIEGRHFMDRAFKDKGEEARATILAGMKEGFDEAVKDLGPKKSTK